MLDVLERFFFLDRKIQKMMVIKLENEKKGFFGLNCGCYGKENHNKYRDRERPQKETYCGWHKGVRIEFKGIGYKVF